MYLRPTHLQAARRKGQGAKEDAFFQLSCELHNVASPFGKTVVGVQSWGGVHTKDRPQLEDAHTFEIGGRRGPSQSTFHSPFIMGSSGFGEMRESQASYTSKICKRIQVGQLRWMQVVVSVYGLLGLASRPGLGTTLTTC